MTASWVRLMAALREDPDLAAVVVTGAPAAPSTPAATCPGSSPSRTPGVRPAPSGCWRSTASWLTIKAWRCPPSRPSTAHAIGAGFALALACDIRYAAADARLGVPFTSLGLHPGMATTWSLPDVAGPAVARDLLLTGRIVTGRRRSRLGLVSRAVPADEVLGRGARSGRAGGRGSADRHPADAAAVRDGGHATYETALQWEAPGPGGHPATATSMKASPPPPRSARRRSTAR